jgi:hypothetical protein
MYIIMLCMYMIFDIHVGWYIYIFEVYIFKCVNVSVKLCKVISPCVK